LRERDRGREREKRQRRQGGREGGRERERTRNSFIFENYLKINITIKMTYALRIKMEKNYINISSHHKSFFFFAILVFEPRAYTLNRSTSPFL
jgi:hypothetical protein